MNNSHRFLTAIAIFCAVLLFLYLIGQLLGVPDIPI
jgi:hypothetical protein